MEIFTHARLSVFIYDTTERRTAVCTAELSTVRQRKDKEKETFLRYRSASINLLNNTPRVNMNLSLSLVLNTVRK